MRTLENARRSWQDVKRCNSIRDLKTAVRLDPSASIATEGARSACWKAFLLFESTDIDTWQRTLSSSRSAYNSLRAHFLRPLESTEDVEAGYDPLSEQPEASPWTQLRKDEELRTEIVQDVTRCMPDNLYFRQPDTQQMLLDILFVFCKLNPDISYRQGMHELLAPILWVVEHDAIDLGLSSKAMGEDAVIANIFDADHIEHDTFALFGQTMQNAKNFYEQTTTSGKENPIVVRSRLIFDKLLPKVDEQLARHLQSIDIVPQVFLIRWIRLLFGREFAFDDLLTMWDVIFAEDPTLELVNEICLVMLLRIRWQLLDGDYNTALALLLRYPEPEKELSAQACVLDALYLREHMDYRGGTYLVSKYSGKPLQQTGRPTTPPALQRNVTTIAGVKPPRVSRPATSSASSSTLEINKVIQSAAKDIYARGEKLGIGKAMRNAVEEVHKRAQEIRDAPTPSPPVIHRTRGSRSSFGTDSVLRRIKALEDRNKSLAKLLEGATSELYAYQRSVVEKSEGTENATTESALENLLSAIAKVQFVQVYLEDPSLTLSSEATQGSSAPDGPAAARGAGEDKPVESKDSVTHPLASEPSTRSQVNELADPASFEDIDRPLNSAEQQTEYDVSRGESNMLDSEPGTALRKSEHATPARPPLEQSSFSWMLGDQKAPAGPRSSSLASGRTRNKGFLFGDERQ